jgi:hypothetical protein
VWAKIQHFYSMGIQILNTSVLFKICPNVEEAELTCQIADFCSKLERAGSNYDQKYFLNPLQKGPNFKFFQGLKEIGRKVFFFKEKI